MFREDSVNRLKNQQASGAHDSLVITRNELNGDNFQENNEIYAMDGDDHFMIDRKASVKKGFFSMIDSVLGGAQSKNISMISNTYSQYQNVPNTVKESSPKLAINIMENDKFGQCLEISPTMLKQQKIYDTNTTMVSSNFVNSFSLGQPNLDNSLFEAKAAEKGYAKNANYSNMLFQ